MARLDRELARLERLVDGGALADGRGLVGIEVEFHLVDHAGRPSLRNAEVLAALSGGPHDVQTELARFNAELNLVPTPLRGTPLADIRAQMDAARAALSAAVPGTEAITIGILPTLSHADIGPSTISDRRRYRELNSNIMAARGGSIELEIDGADPTNGDDGLSLSVRAVILEAAATSLQVHLDLSRDGLVAAWNVAQAVAALQVAAAANAPTLLGRRLWHETRIPLFEQLIDVRAGDERDHGDRPPPPRVWFGERWIGHPADLFAENLRHFRRPLVGRGDVEEGPEGHRQCTEDEGSTEDGGGAEDGTDLDALVLHNSTVWRWNRPVYAVHAGRPTLRIENRVLSAPPTSIDGCADVALLVGLVAGLSEHADALTTELTFADAERNFRTAARGGLGAELRWPGHTSPVDTATLLQTGLIDIAAEGLDALGVPASESGPALEVIADRTATGRNGAAWQLATLADEEQRHDRPTALRRMLQRYRDLQARGEPVHRWPRPGSRGV